MELLDREGSRAAPGAVTLANKVFSDALFDELRQTVDRSLGVAVPDTASWGPLELHREFADSSLSDADRKKLLRKHKMDSSFNLLPGTITEEQRRKLSASAKEKEAAMSITTLLRGRAARLTSGLGTVSGCASIPGSVGPDKLPYQFGFLRQSGFSAPSTCSICAKCQKCLHFGSFFSPIVTVLT